jgi:hypothetical protein
MEHASPTSAPSNPTSWFAGRTAAPSQTRVVLQVLLVIVGVACAAWALHRLASVVLVLILAVCGLTEAIAETRAQPGPAGHAALFPNSLGVVSVAVGGLDARGYHHLLWELVDNSVDEAINGHAKRIDVVLDPDMHGATVIDAYTSPLPSVTVVRPADPRPEVRLGFPTVGAEWKSLRFAPSARLTRASARPARRASWSPHRGKRGRSGGLARQEILAGSISPGLGGRSLGRSGRSSSGIDDRNSIVK